MTSFTCYSTPEAAELAAMQSSPTGQAKVLYKVGNGYTHSRDMAIRALDSGYTVRPLIKHRIRGNGGWDAAE